MKKKPQLPLTGPICRCGKPCPRKRYWRRFSITTCRACGRSYELLDEDQMTFAVREPSPGAKKRG